MKIIRGALSAADVSNPGIRYDADCDCLQMTPDGGTTWNAAPGLDPRHAPGFLKPPVGGVNKQCDAAANMVKWLHDFIDQMLFDFLLVGTVTTIINSILLELEILAPYIELLAIISELAETISAIGGTALAAAFTSDQYDLLLCIFFCNEDSQGRVDAAGLAAIEAAVTAQLNTTAALVVNAILFVQGEVGLSNAGAIGSETGTCDCPSCDDLDLEATYYGTITKTSNHHFHVVATAAPDFPSFGYGCNMVRMGGGCFEILDINVTLGDIEAFGWTGCGGGDHTTNPTGQCVSFAGFGNAAPEFAVFEFDMIAVPC